MPPIANAVTRPSLKDFMLPTLRSVVGALRLARLFRRILARAAPRAHVAINEAAVDRQEGAAARTAPGARGQRRSALQLAEPIESHPIAAALHRAEAAADTPHDGSQGLAGGQGLANLLILVRGQVAAAVWQAVAIGEALERSPGAPQASRARRQAQSLAQQLAQASDDTRRFGIELAIGQAAPTGAVLASGEPPARALLLVARHVS